MTKYQCPKCAWIGTEYEMDADWFNWGDEDDWDEVWSNWICPSCGTWHQLEDYKEVTE